MTKILRTKIENLVYIIRGTKVMLDSDLADIYNVETRVLNQSVSRNKDRFPSDFAFKLKKDWVKEQIS